MRADLSRLANSVLHCGGKSRRGYLCFKRPTFVVGLVGSGNDEWRAACAQHLAQVVRAQVERLKPHPPSMVVAPVTRTATPPTT
jgi:hypothetical protein